MRRTVPDASNWTWSTADLNEPPHSWIIIEPQFTNSRNVEVLVATAETVLVVDGNDSQDQVRQGNDR